MPLKSEPADRSLPLKVAHSDCKTHTVGKESSFANNSSLSLSIKALLITPTLCSSKAARSPLYFTNSNYQLSGLQVVSSAASSSSKLSSSNGLAKFDFLTSDVGSLSNGLASGLPVAGQQRQTSSAYDSIGPQFVIEPPSNVLVPNTSGFSIQCEASGQPAVRINWLKADNSELEPVGKLRKIGSDGSLIFSKFSPAEFRPDVHNAPYKCIASNSVGRIASRTVRVKASEYKLPTFLSCNFLVFESLIRISVYPKQR